MAPDKSLAAEIEAGLSSDARQVAAAWFGGMKIGGTSHLRFAMVEHRPSPRAQAGLDELVSAGIISRENEQSGAVTYRPLVCCRHHLSWAFEQQDSIDSFRLVDRIEPGKRPKKRAGTITLAALAEQEKCDA